MLIYIIIEQGGQLSYTHSESNMNFLKDVLDIICHVINNTTKTVTGKIGTHSFRGFANYAKNYLLQKYVLYYTTVMLTHVIKVGEISNTYSTCVYMYIWLWWGSHMSRGLGGGFAPPLCVVLIFSNVSNLCVGIIITPHDL